MSQRTTLNLDQQAKEQLAELADLHGTQTAAVHEAIALAYAQAVAGKRRRAFIDWLVEESGEPSAEDRAWARGVAVDVAAAKASLKP